MPTNTISKKPLTNLGSLVDAQLNRYRRWRYKNTALMILSLVVLFFTLDSPIVQTTIVRIGRLGYLGALAAGVFFVSTFTVGPAAVLLFHLADLLNPIATALIAGAGAVLGDYLIFRFLRDRVYDELKPVFLKLGGTNLSRLFSTPYFGWLVPLIGGTIIASPLPDELGIAIIGLSHISKWQFIALSFLLNSVGILIIILIAQAF